MIKEPIKKYYQKSKLFLYPHLSIPVGSGLPSQTFIGIKDDIDFHNYKLIVFYQDEVTTFVNFHILEKLLQRCSRFDDFKTIEQGLLYIFDFSDVKEDWNNFLLGKYSKFSTDFKNKILNHYKVDKKNYTYFSSFLYPEKFYEIYAKMFDCDINLLRSVGELLDPPDLSKEMLNPLCIEKLDLYLQNKILNK